MLYFVFGAFVFVAQFIAAVIGMFFRIVGLDVVADNIETKGAKMESALNDSPSRTWMLTISAEHFDRDFIAAALESYRYVGQMEVGEKNGYKHWQILIDQPSTAGAIKFDTLRKAFPSDRGGSVRIIRYDKRRGTKQDCFNYVTKTETAIHDSRIQRGDWSQYEHGKTKKETNNRDEYLAGLVYRATVGGETVASICQGMSIDDDKRYRQTLERRQLDYLTEQHSNKTRDVKVNYLEGPSRVGKTTLLRNSLGGDVYRISNYRKEPWDEYRGQKKIIIDEFRGQIGFSEMLNILDGHPMILGARYHNKILLADEIWVVSNRKFEHQYLREKENHPEDWEAFAARFQNVYRLTKRGGEMELIATPAADQAKKFEAADSPAENDGPQPV